jgi:hypothetical protein
MSMWKGKRSVRNASRARQESSVNEASEDGLARPNAACPESHKRPNTRRRLEPGAWLEPQTPVQCGVGCLQSARAFVPARCPTRLPVQQRHALPAASGGAHGG